METIWKPVVGYEGLYEVSNTGLIRSLFRYKKTLKYNITVRGYATVELFKNKESKRLLVHRIVANVFIPNPDNLPQINHIDENPLNNSVSNLEWCTAKYNANYGSRTERIKAHNNYKTEKRRMLAFKAAMISRKPVIQHNSNGISIRYESAKQASIITGIDYSHICDAAKGKRKTAGGYRWEYERSGLPSVSQ